MKNWYKIARHGESITKLIEDWNNGSATSKEFVEEIVSHIKWGWADISKDPTVRDGITKAIKAFSKTDMEDWDSLAKKIAALLSMATHAHEEMFE